MFSEVGSVHSVVIDISHQVDVCQQQTTTPERTKHVTVSLLGEESVYCHNNDGVQKKCSRCCQNPRLGQVKKVEQVSHLASRPRQKVNKGNEMRG